MANSINISAGKKWLEEKAKPLKSVQPAQSVKTASPKKNPSVKIAASPGKKVQTTRQRMLYQPEEKERWYKGDRPTSGEALAQIYKISKTDREQGEQLFEAFKGFQADPSTPFYSPYSAPTNQAVKALSELGLDVSGGITKEWLTQNAALMGAYRTGTAGTPLAPSSKSTAEQDAAYWYYKLLDAEDVTERAETEWEALQEEIRYWTGRKDRNYSDEEVLSRIDWSDYPTLAKMDEAKAKGVPLALNRSVGYSRDALSGVLWAARNGRSTGNVLADSTQYALGAGVQYRRDDAISARLDPMSEHFSPYAAGATLDDAALYFGVSSFGPEWLENNRSVLASGDKTAIKYYQKVYDAEQATQKAEAERDELYLRIENRLLISSDPDFILDGLLEGESAWEESSLSMLAKMDESRKSGNLLPTTRAVDYRWEDVEAYVRERCQEKKDALQADDYAQEVSTQLGMVGTPSESQAAINAARNNAIDAAGATIKEYGTAEERISFQTAYSADYATFVEQMSAAIQNGTVDAAAGYGYSMERANQYATKHYMSAKAVIEPYDEAAQRRDAALIEIAEIEAQGTTNPADFATVTGTDPDGTIHFTNDMEGLFAAEAEDRARQERLLTLQGIVSDSEAYMQGAQSAYDAAMLTVNDIREGYAVTERLRQLSGADDSEVPAHIREGAAENGLTILDYVNSAHFSEALSEVHADVNNGGLLAQIGRYLGTTPDTTIPTIQLDEIDVEMGAAVAGTVVANVLLQAEDVFLSIAGLYDRTIGGGGAEASDLARENVERKRSEVNSYVQEHGDEATRFITDALSAAGGSITMAMVGGWAAAPLRAAASLGLGGTKLVKALDGLYKIGRTAPFALVNGLDQMEEVEASGGSGLQAASAFLAGFSITTLSENIFQGGWWDRLGGKAASVTLPGKLLNKAFGANAGQFVVDVLKTMASEPLEEGFEKFGSKLLTDVIISQGLDPDEYAQMWKDAPREMAIAAVSGGLMNVATLPSYAPSVKLANEMLSGSTPMTADSVISMVEQSYTDMSDPAMSSEADAAITVAVEESTPENSPNLPDNAPQSEGEGKPAEAETGAQDAPREAQEGIDANTEESGEATPQDRPPVQAGMVQGGTTAGIDALTRQVNALTTALTTTDTASRTATIASVLSEGQASSGIMAAAGAAAQHIVGKYGSGQAVKTVRDTLITAAENGIGQEQTSVALTIAALTDGSASSAQLAVISQNGANAESVAALVTSAAQDMQDEGAQAVARTAVTENQIAGRVKELIGDGALDGIRSYETAYSQARSNLREAGANLRRAQAEYATAGRNAQSINAQFISDTSNMSLFGALQQAIKDVQGKATVAQQMEQSVAKYQQQVQEAGAQLATARESALKRIREQARADVFAAREENYNDSNIDAEAESTTPIDAEARKSDSTSPSSPHGKAERQFATQTAQASQTMPEWLKNELYNNPDERFYDEDTNRAQVERAWECVQQSGIEAERDRLLSLDRFSEDDTAEANLIMAIAFHNNDAETALALASHYNKEGSKAGKEMQARKLFSRMSPTGAKVFIGGQIESRMQDYMREHEPKQREMNDRAGQVEEALRALPDAAETTDSRWGIALNAQQLALIRQYGLEKTARPGIHYNRATTKQRMLEAILSTPNPLAPTGGGLTLVQRLQYMSDGVAVVTGADLDYIGAQLAAYIGAGQEGGGRDADLAITRAYEAFGNITPATTREKIRTQRYVNMLLSLPSALRNIIGNVGQNASNATAHGIATALDAVIGHFTGERTTASLTMADRAAGWRAFVDETKNTFLDYFIDRADTSRTKDKYNTSQRGRVFQNPVQENARILEGFLMSVGDRNFWRKAFVNSLAEQNKLNDQHGMARTQAEILEQAEADANYATFTEDSAVVDALSKLKRVPVIGDALDLLMPFTGVPINITKRMFQFSPFGLVTTAIQHGCRAIKGDTFDQRAFVNGMARGLTGSALFGLGMVLRQIGFIKLGTGDEDDDKRYGIETARGEQYTPYIYNPFTGEYVGMAVFAPMCSPMIMGAVTDKLFQEEDDILDGLMNACFAAGDQILDASYMTGISDVFRGRDGITENLVNALLSSAMSQSIPAVIGQVATALDPYVRDTKDKNKITQALNTLVSKIPVLRETLPEKVDIAGVSVQSKEGLRNFLDPFYTTEAGDDPALDELMRLSDSLGSNDFLPSDALSGTKTELKGVAAPVTGKDKEAYRKRYGELWRLGGTTYNKNGGPIHVTGVTDLIQTSAYQEMSDEDKAKAIREIVGLAKVGATYEIGETLGHVLTGGTEDLPQTFQADIDEPYMQQAVAVWKATGEDSALPRPLTKFSYKKMEYVIAEDEMETWNAAYKEGYIAKLNQSSKTWDKLNDEEKLEALKAAHRAGHEAAKTWYMKLHGIK